VVLPARGSAGRTTPSRAVRWDPRPPIPHAPAASCHVPPLLPHPLPTSPFGSPISRCSSSDAVAAIAPRPVVLTLLPRLHQSHHPRHPSRRRLPHRPCHPQIRRLRHPSWLASTRTLRRRRPPRPASDPARPPPALPSDPVAAVPFGSSCRLRRTRFGSGVRPPTAHGGERPHHGEVTPSFAVARPFDSASSHI
jgi:hypothetical protein